jgi:hypothetical protein
MKTAAIRLTAIVLFAVSLKAETCQSMLKPYFDWANQLHPVRTPTISDDRYPVNVTFTTQTAAGGYLSLPDPVWYAQGELDLIVGGWMNTLASNLVALPRTRNPAFQVDPKYTWDLRLYPTGLVSVQMLIKNTPVGGMPPTFFSATCSNGLVQGVVNNTAYTISLVNGPFVPAPPK